MIDKSYLDGLKFRDSKPKEVTNEGGRKVIAYSSFERGLEVQDILSTKDYGDYYVIVTGDGRKYNIKKNKSIKKEVTNAIS